jgi:dTDP-4-amino-4,6-dideoxygalactose transaminase
MIPINKPSLTYEEVRAVVRVLRSGILTSKSGSGPNVLHFEAVFSKFVGTRYAAAMNSGTAALHAALLAAGVGEGDEVVVPSLTFVATAEAVVLTGAKPVFVEIDPNTYCIDPEEIEAALTSRTKAVIPVHLYGLTGDMDRIMGVAKNNHLVVIEDAAQAHGAEYKGRQAGSLGDMACFSFYGSKNMVTGEGGMVTTNSSEYNETLRHLRNHGEARRYQSTMLGHNYRMPEMEAALGAVQLMKLPEFVESRRRNAAYLMEKLKSVDPLQLPTVPATCVHACSTQQSRE